MINDSFHRADILRIYFILESFFYKKIYVFLQLRDIFYRRNCFIIKSILKEDIVFIFIKSSYQNIYSSWMIISRRAYGSLLEGITFII